MTTNLYLKQRLCALPRANALMGKSISFLLDSLLEIQEVEGLNIKQDKIRLCKEERGPRPNSCRSQ